MGRNLKYVSPNDFKKKSLVNSSASCSNRWQACEHGLTKPGVTCTAACYKIFYPKKNKGLGVSSDAPKAGCTQRCPNCRVFFSKTAFKKHLENYAQYDFHGHYTYWCVPDNITSSAQLEELQQQQEKVLYALKLREVCQEIEAAGYRDEIFSSATDALEVVKSAWMLYASPIAHNTIMRGCSYNIIAECAYSLVSTQDLQLEDSNEILFSNTQFSVVAVENPIENFCCATCLSSGYGNCEVIQAIADEYALELDVQEDQWDHRARNYGIYADLLGGNFVTRSGKPKRIPTAWRKFVLNTETCYIHAGTTITDFQTHLVDPDLMIRKMPLLNVSPYDLMSRHKLVPTGNVMRDIDRALYQETISRSRTDLSIIVDGTLNLVSFENWRDLLAFSLERDMRGDFWTKKQFDIFLKRPLPAFLVGFPQHTYEAIASGFTLNPFSKITDQLSPEFSLNPFRYIGKQVTLGFIDGLLLKIKELFGAAWNACTMVGDFFTRMFKKITSSISEMLGSLGRGGALTDCALPIAGLLGATGVLWLLSRFSDSIGVHPALISACGLGVCMYVLCKYLQFKHHDALRRAKLFWEQSRGLFGDRVDSEVTEQVVAEINITNPELYQLVESLSDDPVGIEGMDDDVEFVAADSSFLLHTGVLWKLVLLMVPVTCVGFKDTVSVAKDLTVLYGGKEVAGKFTQDFIGGIQETYYQATGKHADFLGYMYTCAGVDFEQWRNDVVLYTTSSPASMFLSIQDRLAKLRKLRDQGEKLSMQMSTGKVPTPYLTSFNDTLKNLDKALIEINQALTVGTWRSTPFCVWLYGDSHVGKSVCSQYLIDDMLNILDYPKTGRVYARNGTDQFWSCYKHQAAVLYDDFGAVQEGAHFDEAEIIRLVSPAPSPLNMANLEAKGNTCFTSDFVFMTANQKGLTPTAVVHNKKAFENRRNVVVHVTVNPGGKYRDRYRFTVLYRNDPYLPIDGLQDLDYDAFLNYCVESAKVFRAEQKSLTGAPHGSIFEALKAIRAEAEEYFQTLEGVAPLDTWLEFNSYTNKITTLTNLVKEIRDATLSEALFAREFMGPGLISRLRRAAVPAAFMNMQNQLENNINPFISYADDFALNQLERLLAKTLVAAVTEEELQVDRLNFREKVTGWFLCVKEKLGNLPFWVKLLLGSMGICLIGYPLFRYLQGFWTCRSVGDFFALGSGLSCVAAGSLASSQDQFTKRAKSGRDRRRYIMEGSSWDNAAEETTVSDRGTKAMGDNPILKYILGFQSYDDPNCKVRALALGGTRVAMIYHVWLALQDGVYQVTSLEKSFPFALRKNKISYQRIGKKDLVILDLPPTFVSFPAFSKHWLLSAKDAVSASTGVFANVTFEHRGVMDVELEDAHYASVNSIQTYDSDMLKGIGLGTCMKYLIADDEGKGYIPDFFVRSQCGSLLLAYPLGRKEGMKILSLHCMHIITARAKQQGAKGGREGFGTILTREELEEAELILGEPEHVLADDIIVAASPAFMGEFADAQTVCPLGLVEPGKAPALAGKSSIIPSCISKRVQDTLNIKPTTEPAILNKRDERLKDKDVDILRVGMLKYKQVASDMSPLTPEEDETFYDTFTEIFLPYHENKEDLHLLTEDENLNGVAGESYCDPVVMSTSEGYDWVLSRKNGEKGKARLVQGVPGSYSIDWNSKFGQAIIAMRAECAVKIPCIVGLDTPKDERLPLTKIYDTPKTRLFTILPFEYNYLVREFFGSAIFHMMRRHNDTPMKVGINPLGMEWTLFGKQLHSRGLNWFNGDYSRFDGVTPRCLLVAIAQEFTKLYDDGFYKQRLHLILAATTRLSIAGHCLYRVSGGIPSGFALTVIVNSLVNQFLVQWSWKQMVNSARFVDHVVLGVYGDDNICSVSKRYKDVFNLVTLSQFLAQYGFTLKDGSNKDAEVLPKFNPPEKCDFLKRSFIPYGDRYLAPLAEKSRLERLFWIREGGLSPECATVENVNTFLEEVFQLGNKEVYDKWRRDLTEVCYTANLSIPPLLSYREQEAKWLAGEALQLIDEDEKPEEIIVRNTPMEIVPGVRINTFAFLKANLDTVGEIKIWCGPNCPANLRTDPDVYVVEAPKGEKFPLRATLRNKLKHIKKRGKPVLFGGALDQDLVYFCACFYASMTVQDFSFSKAMMSYFKDDDVMCTRAVDAGHGWKPKGGGK